MSDNEQSNVSQDENRILETQGTENQYLIHILEDAYKKYLGETEQIEIRLRLEEDKVLLSKTKIMNLEEELRNIKGFYNLIRGTR